MSGLVINLNFPHWEKCQNRQSFAVQGYLLFDNRPMPPEKFSGILASVHEDFELSAVLQRLNGFYTWIEKTPGRIRAGVDHIRSRPLFYGQSGGEFFLSDDAEWVRKKVRDTAMDPLAREEFRLAGYVTGADTLFPNVKQLQAGEFLIASQSEAGVNVETHRYYRFLHEEPKKYNEAVLREDLKRVTIDAMKRLIEYANGRQIVIPLSGGYDSRLIASMLKNLGYNNVLCFTYGIRCNTESKLSKQVAESLGFPWVFVEYSKDLWRKEWNTQEAKAYRQMASRHVSLPHVQDWLAVKKLISNEIIEHDSIFSPGHSGDFIAGSHIPGLVFQKKQHTYHSLIESIVKYHLSNCQRTDMQFADFTLLAERITSRISIPFDGTDVSFANLYENWDCQERQAKYIVNSVRVYEQFAHEWWLPQWDLEFVRFWEKVPLALRKERVWFKKWIQQQYADASGCENLNNLGNDDDANSSYLFHSLAKKLASKLPESFMNKIKTIQKNKSYKNHFLAFNGLVSDEEFDKYISDGFNIIGMYSDAEINGKW